MNDAEPSEKLVPILYEITAYPERCKDLRKVHRLNLIKLDPNLLRGIETQVELARVLSGDPEERRLASIEAFLSCRLARAAVRVRQARPALPRSGRGTPTKGINSSELAALNSYIVGDEEWNVRLEGHETEYRAWWDDLCASSHNKVRALLEGIDFYLRAAAYEFARRDLNSERGSGWAHLSDADRDSIAQATYEMLYSGGAHRFYCNKQVVKKGKVFSEPHYPLRAGLSRATIEELMRRELAKIAERAQLPPSATRCNEWAYLVDPNDPTLNRKSKARRRVAAGSAVVSDGIVQLREGDQGIEDPQDHAEDAEAGGFQDTPVIDLSLSVALVVGTDRQELPPMPEGSTDLRHRLPWVEQVMEYAAATFFVGLALIREHRLYEQDGHKDFRAYCSARWSVTRRQVDRDASAGALLIEMDPDIESSFLIDGTDRHASEALKVRPNGSHFPLPANERQLRPLVAMRECGRTIDEVREAWTKSLEVSKGKPTARVVEEIVQRDYADPQAGRRQVDSATAGDTPEKVPPASMRRLMLPEATVAKLEALARIGNQEPTDLLCSVIDDLYRRSTQPQILVAAAEQATT